VILTVLDEPAPADDGPAQKLAEWDSVMRAVRASDEPVPCFERARLNRGMD
jgi:hypothetical protein